MATYCFVEGKQALFTEVFLRGWLAALLDFSHSKSHEECIAAVQGVLAALQGDVCCIDSDEYNYRLLVAAAWTIGYTAVRDLSEREKVGFASALKPLGYDEALVSLRQGGTHDGGTKRGTDEAYRWYVVLVKSPPA